MYCMIRADSGDGYAVVSSLALFKVVCASVLLVGAAVAQTVLPSAPGTTMQTALPTSINTDWQQLTAAQKTALAPLQAVWHSMSDGQRRKWLAMSSTYATLGAAEQAKLQTRMLEWAALSPKEREAARLNFTQSKALPSSDRAANWEAYQALSPEERQKLAQSAKAKPGGAALVIKPVAPEKLVTVPVTRHTPESERATVASQKPLNRMTLLPQAPIAAPRAAASETAAKP